MLKLLVQFCTIIKTIAYLLNDNTNRNKKLSSASCPHWKFSISLLLSSRVSIFLYDGVRLFAPFRFFLLLFFFISIVSIEINQLLMLFIMIMMMATNFQIHPQIYHSSCKNMPCAKYTNGITFILFYTSLYQACVSLVRSFWAHNAE